MTLGAGGLSRVTKRASAKPRLVDATAGGTYIVFVQRQRAMTDVNVTDLRQIFPRILIVHAGESAFV